MSSNQQQLRKSSTPIERPAVRALDLKCVLTTLGFALLFVGNRPPFLEHLVQQVITHILKGPVRFQKYALVHAL